MEQIFKRSFVMAAFLALSAASSGCALFLLGTGVAGGYAISKDEIEGLTDSKLPKVWTSLREVMREEGVITLEDRDRGHMEGIVGKATVETHVEQATEKTVRIRVKARKTKGLFPDIKTAQSIYGKVVKKAEKGYF